MPQTVKMIDADRPNLYAQGTESAPKSAAGALLNTRV
jgi:hypothetical protein